MNDCNLTYCQHIADIEASNLRPAFEELQACVIASNRLAAGTPNELRDKSFQALEKFRCAARSHVKVESHDIDQVVAGPMKVPVKTPASIVGRRLHSIKWIEDSISYGVCGPAVSATNEACGE